ncbi:MAG: Bcr/CflA family drug resistance efflux transporter [Neptuniibacter caesariensis]|uniref:Bcr/CflA family efflux transporter n=1 Tax=Neptuniibacter caesariensis TaxID=207954 RepID=A0A2G6JNT5_NEPCE|nr:MAG: Bcr/CflA family drug resistance efflux transporter [Neptuniibacter caesariensis]
MEQQKPLPPIAYFTIMSMVSPIALNILLPALPDVADNLGVTTSEVQLSLTLYLFSLAVGQLICGPLADRFGRRPVLLVGITIHFVGCLLGAFADDLSTLLTARVLQALGGCTGMVLARTIMLDRFSRDLAAGKIGYITLSIALSQAIAPTLGGHINLQFGWQYLFHFSLLLSTVSWLIVMFMIPETAKEKTGSLRLNRIMQQYWDVLKAPDYLGFALSTTFIAAAFYLFIGSAPYIVDRHIGGSSADFGNWFLLVSLGFMFGSFNAAKLSAKLGIRRMITLGHSLSLLGAIIMLVSMLSFGLNYITLFAPMALFTIGRGFSQPGGQSAGISCSTNSPSTASGLMGFIQLLTGTLIAQVTPLILAFGPIWIMTAILLCPMLAFSAFYTTRKQLN